MDSIENQRSYTAKNISNALHCLATGAGSLEQRVKNAYGHLLNCSNVDGLERHFESVKHCLRTAKAGDYSLVTEDEFQAVAYTVFDMACESIRASALRGSAPAIQSASGIV